VRAWREDSDAIIDRLVAAWDLTLGPEYTGGVAGRAFAAETRDGSGVVVKVGFPHPEAVAEAIAIDAWAPRYAPRLLAIDTSVWAMLLERVLPGTPLSDSDYPPELAFSLACEALAVAHRTPPPPGVPTLAEVVGDWSKNARRMISARPADDRARIMPWLERADQLIAEDDGDALLHGDANPGNVLEGSRELVLIDPKPMRGRAEFDPAPLVEQVAPFTPELLANRVRRAAGLLGADHDLVVAWGAVRAALNVAWAWDDGNSGAPELRALAAWEALSAA
jgi:streptomycin 6-kinase